MPKYILTADGEIRKKVDLASLYDVDELFEQAARLIIEEGKGSASLIQRRLEVGFARAARILDQLEQLGIISHSEGNKPREVIVSSFEEFIESEKKEPEQKEIDPEDIRVDWEYKELTDPLLANLQKEVKNLEGMVLPMGASQKKLVSVNLDEIGHVYIFNSPLCKSIELLTGQLDFLVSTYSPEKLKLIVSDDTRMFSLTSLSTAPHLLTPVIYEQKKITNALGWLISETERRFRVMQETGTKSWSKILCVISSNSNWLCNDDDSLYQIERLLASGHIVGVHLIVSSPLGEKKFARVMTSFPTKVIFKTFSTNQADSLGTDDAFNLASPDEFLFVPAYSQLSKNTVK